MGPGTKLGKRLKRGDPGINRLDRLAKQHDIDYSRATSHKDKLIADRKMVAGIYRFPATTAALRPFPKTRTIYGRSCYRYL